MQQRRLCTRQWYSATPHVCGVSTKVKYIAVRRTWKLAGRGDVALDDYLEGPRKMGPRLKYILCTVPGESERIGPEEAHARPMSHLYFCGHPGWPGAPSARGPPDSIHPIPPLRWMSRSLSRSLPPPRAFWLCDLAERVLDSSDFQQGTDGGGRLVNVSVLQEIYFV